LLVAPAGAAAPTPLGQAQLDLKPVGLSRLAHSKTWRASRKMFLSTPAS